MRSCPAIIFTFFWKRVEAREGFCDTSCGSLTSWSYWPLRNALLEENGSFSESEMITKEIRLYVSGHWLGGSAGSGLRLSLLTAQLWVQSPQVWGSLLDMLVLAEDSLGFVRNDYSSQCCVWPGLWQYWGVIGDLCNSLQSMTCSWLWLRLAWHGWVRTAKIAWVYGLVWLSLGASQHKK